jgi:hypothetical protein
VSSYTIIFSDPDTLDSWGGFFSHPGQTLSDSWDVVYDSYKGLYTSSTVALDVDTGEVLWRHNAERILPIASLTKIMTALLVVERTRPRDPVRITQPALDYTGSGIGLLPKGRRVRAEALLNGLLIVSGNDAAIGFAASQGNFDALRAIVTPDYVCHPDEARGPDGLAEMVQGYRDALTGLNVTIEQQFTEGDYVATRTTIRGRVPVAT